MISHAFQRFLRYATVGISTFIFDLLLLWSWYTFITTQFTAAVAGGVFFIAVSINYFISRSWVFQGTERTIKQGYIYFVSVALCGAVLVTLLMYICVDRFGWNYLLSRSIIAGCIGVGNYLFNLFVNFRVAGRSWLK